MFYKFLAGILCFFSLASCDNQEIDNNKVSHDIDILSRLINLTKVDVISTSWITQTTGNDWVLIAKIKLTNKSKKKLYNKLRKKNRLFDILGELTEKEMLSVDMHKNIVFEYQADIFFSEPLLHGSLALGNNENDIFVYMYTM